jgi:hypothetical protein
MNGMIDFIKNQGKERVEQITSQMDSDFTIQSEKLLMAEKKRL